MLGTGHAHGRNFEKNIVSVKSNVSNTDTVRNKRIDIIRNKDDILVSFDVVSLFANILLTLAIKNIIDKWDKITRQRNIPRQGYR